MATFTMTKKGFESVTFNYVSVIITDTESGVAETEDIYTLTIGKGQNAISVKLDGKVGCEMVYHQYLAKGYKVVETPESKVASPKKPNVSKPKRTREESLTEKYGTKEERKAYMKAKNDFTGFYRRKLCGKVAFNDFHKAVEQCVKNALDQWDANGRPSYEC